MIPNLYDLALLGIFLSIPVLGAIADWLDHRHSTPDPAIQRLHENLNQDLDLECLKPIEIDIGGQKFLF